MESESRSHGLADRYNVIKFNSVQKSIIHQVTTVQQLLKMSYFLVI